MNKKKLITILSGGSQYDAAAQAGFDYIASKSGTLSTAQKGFINTAIVDYKAAGLFAKSRGLYLYVGGNAASHALNWKDPRDLDAAYRMVWAAVGVSHSSAGVTFDKVNGYGDTKLNSLTVFGTNYLSFHSYVKNWTEGIVMADAVSFDWSARFANGDDPIVSNGAAAVSVTASQVTGMSSVIRKDASNLARIYNGVEQIVASAFLANGNGNVFVGAFNSVPAFPSDALVSFQAITDNLTTAEAQTLKSIVLTLETALGRN